jgi:hypothetical protein
MPPKRKLLRTTPRRRGDLRCNPPHSQGWVATYGQIAAIAGLPRRARLVGHSVLLAVRRPTHDRSLRGLLGLVRLAIEGVSSHEAVAKDVLPLFRILRAGSDAVLKALPGAPVPPVDWGAVTDHTPPKEHRRFVMAQAIPQKGAAAPAPLSLAFVRSAARNLGLTPDRGYRVRLTGRAAIDTEQLESVQKDSLFKLLLSVGCSWPSCPRRFARSGCWPQASQQYWSALC